MFSFTKYNFTTLLVAVSENFTPDLFVFLLLIFYLSVSYFTLFQNFVNFAQMEIEPFSV